jgi:hypothetical protein
MRWEEIIRKAADCFVVSVLLSGSNSSSAVRLRLDRVSSRESDHKKERQLVRYIQCLKSYSMPFMIRPKGGLLKSNPIRLLVPHPKLPSC